MYFVISYSLPSDAHSLRIEGRNGRRCLRGNGKSGLQRTKPDSRSCRLLAGTYESLFGVRIAGTTPPKVAYE